jgi:hypothetical protein
MSSISEKSVTLSGQTSEVPDRSDVYGGTRLCERPVRLPRPQAREAISPALRCRGSLLRLASAAQRRFAPANQPICPCISQLSCYNCMWLMRTLRHGPIPVPTAPEPTSRTRIDDAVMVCITMRLQAWNNSRPGADGSILLATCVATACGGLLTLPFVSHWRELSSSFDAPWPLGRFCLSDQASTRWSSTGAAA